MRPRLRRLVSLVRGARPSAPRPIEDREGRAVEDQAGPREAQRRLADAQRRLKQAVPPRED